MRDTRCDAPHDLTVAKKVESLVEEACHSYDFQRTHSPQATGKTLDCFMEGTVSVNTGQHRVTQTLCGTNIWPSIDHGEIVGKGCT